MHDQVVGRDAELQATSAFLRAMAGGPAGLVFAGEPGIGKTTLWRHVIGQARRGWSIGVASARPVARDARYGYAVLDDLFRSMSSGLLARLPWPQQHALAAALLRDTVGAGRAPRRGPRPGCGRAHARGADPPGPPAFSSWQAGGRARCQALGRISPVS